MATDIIRLTLKYRDANNNQFRNVFHYQTLAGASADQADMELMVADVAPLIAAMQPTTVTLYGWEAHKLDGLLQWQPFGKGSYVRAGDVVGDVLPYQAAAVSLGYTNTKKTVGKKWIGPLSETHQNAGLLTEAAYALLQAFCTWYTSEWAGTSVNYAPGSWSKSKGFHAFISGLCNQIIGSQRRRKPGIGI